MARFAVDEGHIGEHCTARTDVWMVRVGHAEERAPQFFDNF